jgi:hypothetical protein
MKSPLYRSFLSLKTIIFTGFVWALLSFFFDLCFHNPLPEQEVPLWSDVGIFIFENVAFFGAGWLCLRNWLYPKILSDRNIWLFLGVGLIFQAIGNVFYAYWELILQREPNASLADPFYVFSYLLLVIGLVLAVRFRRIGLSLRQWAILTLVAGMAILLAWTNATTEGSAAYVPNFGSTFLVASQTEALAIVPEDNSIPAWVVASEKAIEPIIDYLNLSYVVADVVISILVTTLSLTFWGGKFSRTWLAIAMGSLCLYIADMWYATVAARTGSEPVGIVDSFWIFSAILFGIGAALEYDISIHPPRRFSRRTS